MEFLYNIKSAIYFVIGLAVLIIISVIFYKRARRTGSDFPAEIPIPVEGWIRKMIEDGMVEYVRNGERWLWDSKKAQWIPPRNLSDPNPITPTGERLAGPGTM